MLCIKDLYGLKLILIYMVNGQVSGKIWDKIQSVFYPYNRTEQVSLKCQFSLKCYTNVVTVVANKI